MAGDLVRFVDAISASPTTRLDLNDETTWWCAEFSAPTPRLRRAMSSNAMRDGINVSSSQYDSRVVTMRLEARSSTQDLNATEIQKLFRELDRPTNIIKYQPTGATKPVFFRTYRSDTSQLDDIRAQTAMRSITIELLAEPVALGLEETFTSSFTFDASVSTSHEYSTTSILGDVAAPLKLDLTITSSFRGDYYLCSQAFPSNYTAPGLVRSADNSGTLGTDTTGITGAGTGFWGATYLQTTFATDATLIKRVSVRSVTLAAGTYRVLGRASASMNPTTCQLKVSRQVQTSLIPTYTDVMTSPTVTAILGTTNSTIMDFGTFRVPMGMADVGPSTGFSPATTLWSVWASRTSGTGNLRFDGLVFIPVDMDDATSNTSAIATSAGATVVLTSLVSRFDAESDQVVQFTGTTLGEPGNATATTFVGALPQVIPNCTNHLWLLPSSLDTTITSTTLSFTARYNPRYLFVRPSAT